MKKWPFFCSFRNCAPPSIEQKRLLDLRNTLMQSNQQFRFGGWNRRNLINAIQSGDRSKFAVLVLQCTEVEGKAHVVLASHEKLALRDLLAECKQANYPFIFLFVLASPALCSQSATLVKACRIQNHCYVAFTVDEYFFSFGLACELINWWSLSSSLYEDIDYVNLTNCVDAIIQSTTKLLPPTRLQVASYSAVTEKAQVAWHSKLKVADADIEKLRSGARRERILDTYKRMLDASAHRRDQHMPTGERLISSQGLFWLAENSDNLDLENWILSTRFFEDVFPGIAQLSRPPLSNLVRRTTDLRDYLDGILRRMISIEEGVYTFGSDDLSVDSEPPAPQFRLAMPTFRILDSPVTNSDWNKLLESPIRSEPEEFPVVNVSYFDAVFFAKLLNELLRDFRPDLKGWSFGPPTELQWEAAARGIDGLNYPWGNKFIDDYCNCDMRIGNPTPVGSFGPRGNSPYGCCDMSGNVREWTCTYAGTKGVDWSLYPPTTDLVPSVDATSRMIIRGGSYSYDPICVQCWVRNTQLAGRSDMQTGFRLVLKNVVEDE